MTDKVQPNFNRYSVSISMPKLENKGEAIKTYFLKKSNPNEETQPEIVYGSEDDFSLTCWRDSDTSDTNCRYVFGVKSSTNDKHYQFVESNPNGKLLQWSPEKEFSTKEFTDDRIFWYKKSSLDNRKHLRHKSSTKYVSINKDHQILLQEHEAAADISITQQSENQEM